MSERGVIVAHSTILRWAARYIPEFEKRWSRFSRPVGTSWRVEETYVSIKAKWHHLRARRPRSPASSWLTAFTSGNTRSDADAMVPAYR
jgi:hypothetical protein